MTQPWKVVILKSFDKDMANIPKDERERIRVAVNTLVLGPYDCGLDVKPLKGRPEWHLRIGPRRVLFLVDKGKIIITVISVSPRGDAYK